MSLFKFKTLFLIILFSPILALAQSIKDVRINEIQLHHANSLRNEYGQASSWIELYNMGYGKVNIAGCILRVNGKEYQIPKGNPATLMATRGYIVFYADGASDKGTFYTNFTLDDTNFIELYDVDNNLIDRLQFNPADITDGASFGWFEDHDRVEKLMTLPATTPGSSNNTIEKISRAEMFRQADKSGFVLTIINIVAVSIALTMLFFVFKAMGNFHINVAKKKTEAAKLAQSKNEDKANISKTTGGLVTNDELAAIAIALYKYSENLHDIEELTLTINKVSKMYSPWSSKIYGLRQIPTKK